MTSLSFDEDCIDELFSPRHVTDYYNKLDIDVTSTSNSTISGVINPNFHKGYSLCHMTYYYYKLVNELTIFSIVHIICFTLFGLK